MPDNQNQPVKKADVVPKTEVSQGEDKATRRFVAIMITIIVVTVLAGGGVLYWLIGKFVYQSNKNKAQDETIYLLEQKKINIDKLRPNYEKITAKGANGKSDADFILNAMPVDEGFRELIAQLERMGQESGIKVTSITKATAASGTTAQSSITSSYDVSVSLQGQSSKILEFLRKTEKSSRVLDFVSMDTSSAQGNEEPTATATFRAYYQGPANIKPTEKELK